MHLTSFTDYSLRILIILGSNPTQRYKTKDLVKTLDIKLNHATKIINNLANKKYIESYKGRIGGVCISQDLYAKKLSEIIKQLEPLNIVECFKDGRCPILQNCKLKAILSTATDNFTQTLEGYTFFDICNISSV